MNCNTRQGQMISLIHTFWGGIWGKSSVTRLRSHPEALCVVSQRLGNNYKIAESLESPARKPVGSFCGWHWQLLNVAQCLQTLQSGAMRGTAQASEQVRRLGQSNSERQITTTKHLQLNALTFQEPMFLPFTSCIMTCHCISIQFLLTRSWAVLNRCCSLIGCCHLVEKRRNRKLLILSFYDRWRHLPHMSDRRRSCRDTIYQNLLVTCKFLDLKSFLYTTYRICFHLIPQTCSFIVLQALKWLGKVHRLCQGDNTRKWLCWCLITEVKLRNHFTTRKLLLNL